MTKLLTARAIKDLLHSPLAMGAMLYIVLPNLVFFLIGRELFIDRPLINSDYLLLWIGSCYLSRRSTIVLFALLFDLDLILSTESIYHFSTVETILAAREILDSNPAIYYAFTGGLVLLSLAALGMAFRKRVIRLHLSKRGQILVGIVALALSGVSVARSIESVDSLMEIPFGNHAILGSGIVETGFSSFDLAMESHQRRNEVSVAGTATSGISREIAARQSPINPYDVVVILVEAQGLLKNRDDMRRVLAPLIDSALQSRYTIKTGAVRFYGATMFGELRTLCRIYLPHATPANLPRLEQCLPNELRGHGYETVSYHGFYRWFYERDRWYPAVGFQRSYFAEDLMPLAPPSARCGMGFQILCDLWIADQVEHDLLMPGARSKFVYWLTVNSHYPIDSGLAGRSSFDCASTETLREEGGSCDLARIHFQLYARIARMAQNPGLRPTRFVIVGDHSPPFPTLSERALYDEERVPFVQLIPRTAANRR